MSLSNHQKGFAVIPAVIATVIVLLGAAGYIYWQYGLNKSDSSTLTSQEKAELKAACKVEIDDELLCSLFSTWGDTSAEPATVTTTTTAADGSKNTFVIKQDGDNYHSVFQHEGHTMESIKIGNDTYSKMEGVWYKSTATDVATTDIPTEEDSNPNEQTDEIINEEEASKVKYTKVGNEKCGDATCVKYEVTYEGEPGTTTFWIDPKNSRLMRLSSTDSDGGTYDSVYVYGAVTITAPEGAKDYSELMSGMGM